MGRPVPIKLDGDTPMAEAACRSPTWASEGSHGLARNSAHGSGGESTSVLNQLSHTQNPVHCISSPEFTLTWKEMSSESIVEQTSPQPKTATSRPCFSRDAR